MMRGSSQWARPVLAAIGGLGPAPAASAFVVTSMILTAHEPDRCNPPPPQQSFTIVDRVYVWIDWEGYEAGTPYRYEFRSPSGQCAHQYESARRHDDDGCSWATAPPQALYDAGPGQWTVKFYYDGALAQQATFTLEDPGTFEDLHYTPPDFRAGGGMLVVLHGANARAVSYYHYFKPMADAHGVVLLVPNFEPDRWPGFNLMFTPRGRVDEALLRMIESLARRTGADKNNVTLFGHSAGGQLAHRFLLAHPDVVTRCVISAPGQWTFPRTEWAFPYGVGPSRGVPPGMRWLLDQAAQVDTVVLVGEDDTKRDRYLDTSRQADLQGANRLERAAHWVNQMTLTAFRRKRPVRLYCHTVHAAGHSNMRSRAREEIETALFARHATPEVVGAMAIERSLGRTNAVRVTVTVYGRSDAGCDAVAVGSDAATDRFEPAIWRGTPGSIQTAQVPVRLSEGEGMKFLFGRIRDRRGRESGLFGDAIFYSPPILGRAPVRHATGGTRAATEVH